MKGKGSYWLRSGAYTFLEKFLLQLFRFGSFFLLVRGLTRELFGTWTIFLIISAFVETARMGLIQNALIKFLTATEDTKIKGRINTASLVLNVLVTAFSCIILFILAQTSHTIFGVRILDDIIYLYIFTTVALIPFFQFNFIQQANMDFKGIFYSNIIRQGIFFVYVLTIFVMPDANYSLVYLAAVQTIAAAIASLFAIFYGRKYMAFSDNLDFDWLKALFKYGKFVVGTNLGSMLNKSIDQVILGIMISPIATGIYGTAIKITNLVEVPTQSIAAIVFPQSTKRLETSGKEAVKNLYEKSVGVILALIIPGVIFVLIFPEFVIMLVAGEKYLDAVPVLRVTMLFGLFVPYARQFGTMMDAIGKPGVNFFLVLVSAGLNLILNYLLIQYFGLIGAAYATLLTFAILFVANQIILYREIGVQTLNTLYYAQEVYRNGFLLMKQKILKRSYVQQREKVEEQG